MDKIKIDNSTAGLTPKDEKFLDVCFNALREDIENECNSPIKQVELERVAALDFLKSDEDEDKACVEELQKKTMQLGR